MSCVGVAMVTIELYGLLPYHKLHTPHTITYTASPPPTHTHIHTLTSHTHVQLPSEALDLAIAKLPHPPSPSSHHHNPRPSSSASSSPSHTRRKNRYATVDLYDHPRPFGRVALHEKLLEFISQEWASILTQVQ